MHFVNSRFLGTILQIQVRVADPEDLFEMQILP
jgi:hypothetical protein